MKQMIRRAFHMIFSIGKRFLSDRLTYAASALTFTTLLAVVPLMTVSVSILSAFPVFDHVSAEVQQFIFQNFIPESGEAIQQYLSAFSTQAGKLSLIGTLFLIVTAVMMILTIERAFNDIWRVRRLRQGMFAWLHYWAILSLAPIFIVAVVATTTYVISLPFVLGTAKFLGLKTLLFGSIPFLLTWLLLTLIYRLIPNCHVPNRAAILGAFVAAFLFELLKKGFVIYLQHFATYQFIYGAMAAIPIFLLWIYLVWVVVLFGALIANVFVTHTWHPETDHVDGLLHAVLWLKILWQAQKKGEGVTLRELQVSVKGQNEIAHETQLAWFLKLHFIQGPIKHRYVLTRDLSTMTLSDLYRELPWKLPTDINETKTPEALRAIFEKANVAVGDILEVPLSELYS